MTEFVGIDGRRGGVIVWIKRIVILLMLYFKALHFKFVVIVKFVHTAEVSILLILYCLNYIFFSSTLKVDRQLKNKNEL